MCFAFISARWAGDARGVLSRDSDRRPAGATSYFPALCDHRVSGREVTTIDPLVVGIVIGVGAIAFLLGFLLRKSVAEARIQSAETAAKKILDEAVRETEARKREAVVEAKDEAFRIKREAEREIREERAELQRLERGLVQREENLERKGELQEKRERLIGEKEQEVQKAREDVEALRDQQKAELERISGLTADQAREQLLRQIAEEVKSDAAALIKKIESAAREEGAKRAREIVALAVQRVAADHTAEVTVSVVPLPNEEMKGRVIGREGRNIRTLESLTGVDVIIDDTPEAVTLSSFDPVRREVAKLALEKLIADGRIHPARIEEMVGKSQRELEARIGEEGERAAFEASVHGLHPEEIKILGRLKFRHSYGQNLLQHSVEVSLLAGLLATYLDADAALARRPGARKETVEMCIKRLENLERLATSFPGVEKAYAIQAAREIRVLVKPAEIDDLTAAAPARALAKKIESDLEYPGQIKVTVLRETRAIEYAR